MKTITRKTFSLTIRFADLVRLMRAYDRKARARTVLIRKT